jgi:hypothetical protein
MKATLTGTAGEDREGGVATDSAGNVYEALSAEGPVDGQPNAGAKDVVLIKYGPTGTKLWTKGFGTAGVDRAYGLQLDPQGHPVIVGYTKGNFDGAHTGNTSDDIFVTKYDPSGPRGAQERRPTVAATAPRRRVGGRLDLRHGLHEGRSRRPANLGDKDVTTSPPQAAHRVNRAVRNAGRGQRAWRSPSAAAPSVGGMARHDQAPLRARRQAASTASRPFHHGRRGLDKQIGTKPTSRSGASPPTVRQCHGRV